MYMYIWHYQNTLHIIVHDAVSRIITKQSPSRCHTY